MTRAARALRWAEMLGVFFGLPAAVAVFTDPSRRFEPLFVAAGGAGVFEAGVLVGRRVIPLLLVFGAILAAALLLDRGFDRRILWDARAFRRDARRIFTVFGVMAPMTLAIAWSLDTFTGEMTRGDGESAFLWLPRNAPLVLVLIAIGYPWFSVYPQEITHRAFFFHRYREILPGRWTLILVNAVAFSWFHAPFWNWIALVMTFIGGLFFAYTFERTRSVLAATVEHALYGWWAFAVGLGWFVFAGSLS